MAARVSGRWWVAAWLALALQLWVLYAPSVPDAASFAPPFADKLVHGFVFGLAVWAWSRLRRRWAWLIAALFAAHAVASEFIQWRFLAERTGDPWDVVADLAGVALGLGAALRWRRP